MKKKKRTNRRPQKLQQNIRNTLSGHRTAKKKSDKPSQEGEAASNAPGIKRKKNENREESTNGCAVTTVMSRQYVTPPFALKIKYN